MNVKERSFWQTTAGVVTGVAGTLTALVGLLTVAVQVGWLGSSGSSNKPASNVAPGASSSTTAAGGSFAGSTPTTVAATPLFDASPTTVTFDKLGGSREAVVTVRNTGTVPLLFSQPPSIGGVNASAFSATNLTCSTRLDAGRSCEIQVKFTPPRAGDYSAKLVIQVTGAPAREVPLQGGSLL